MFGKSHGFPNSLIIEVNKMLVIGLDVGTTGTKAVVADESGKILAGAYREYELKSTSGGIVSQNAEDWWDAVVYTIGEASKKVDAKQIRAIGISTQGASMLAADENGAPLCEVMTWMDSRASAETEYLAETVGAEKVYEKCGWPLTPSGDAAKILWLKNHMPEVFEKAHCFPSTLEFVNRRLTGKEIIDPTNGAIRQLFNIRTGKWDEEILSAVGINENRLPQVMPVGEIVGNLTEEAAEALGLTTDVAVFCGAHDQYCASLGSGAVESGDMLLATGTAWVVLGVTDKLLYTGNHICPGIHPADGKFGAMASLVSAGSALKWYKNIISGSFREMDEEAEKRAESAKDLFVLPYVAGAGFPHNKPDVGGTLTGFRLGHDKFDIARAFMEGVAFEARCVLDEFEASGMKISKLMMTGGAARSDVWSRIVGYITGCEIYRPEEPETCCVGAAMTAFKGLGVFSDYTECKKAMVKATRLECKDDSLYEFYNEKYARYNELIGKYI